MLEMCARARRAAAAGLLVDLARTPRRTSTASRATCASWRCWRCRWASRSPTRACRWGRTINEFTTAWDVVVPRRRAQPRAWASTRSTSSRPRRRWTSSTRSTRDKIFLVQLADFMWQEVAHLRGAHGHRAALPRLPRRGRAQRAGGRAGAAAGRAGLPRRLQLRGVQRRLPADAAAGGGRARAPLGAVAGRGRAAPLGAVARRHAPAQGARTAAASESPT